MNNTFNPDIQYRCTIIRGKAQSEMDNLLPAYANIIAEICPCSKDEFDNLFNDKLSQLFYKKDFTSLDENRQKTVRNHITETAGKLFGLYYHDLNDTYYESPANAKLIADNDQPAFFKNLCLNFQFPNGSQKINTILERIEHEIRFKPFHFVIALLDYASKKNVFLTKDEVGYYVLNAEQVLQGKITVSQVFAKILEDRNKNLTNKVPRTSRDWQHIKEQFNLLALANLLTEQDEFLCLNQKERTIINYFIEQLNLPLEFDIYSYNLVDKLQQDQMFADWTQYYGEINVKNAEILTTDLQALILSSPTEIIAPVINKHTKVDKNALGEEGEQFVFEYEKKRVKKTHPRLVNQVKLLATQKGLGYDISSVEAEESLEYPEFLRMIEVKATKRVTAPNIDDLTWQDTITLTRREWMTAKQHRNTYNIYRVYFTPTLTIIRKINDPFTKAEEGIIDVKATHYRMDFNSNAIDGEYL